VTDGASTTSPSSTDAGSIEEAVAKARADAATGVAEASNLLATLAGAGVGMAQSWPAAFEHLAQAARDGSESARGQLVVLGDPSSLESDDRWEALAASIRVEGWTAMPSKRVVRASPRLVAIEGFLSPRARDWLIGLARGRLKPAPVYDPTGGASVGVEARTNSFVEFGVLNCDVVLLLVRQRIASTLGVPLGALENSQVLHYDVGEEFVPHYDFLDPAFSDASHRGQRIVTFLIYLNADFDGGETEFPRLDLRHKGGAGDALYFVNLDSRGIGDPRTLHAGAPPTRGEKWLLSQWVRNRARG